MVVQPSPQDGADCGEVVTALNKLVSVSRWGSTTTKATEEAPAI